MRFQLRRVQRCNLLFNLSKLSSRFLTSSNLTKSKNLQPKLMKRKWKSSRRNMTKKK